MVLDADQRRWEGEGWLRLWVCVTEQVCAAPLGFPYVCGPVIFVRWHPAFIVGVDVAVLELGSCSHGRGCLSNELEDVGNEAWCVMLEWERGVVGVVVAAAHEAGICGGGDGGNGGV